MASPEIEKLYSELKDASPGLVIREDGESFVWVCLIRAASRRALDRAVKARNWHKPGDCTGQIYKASCEMLRCYRVGNEHIGVVLCGNYYDV